MNISSQSHVGHHRPDLSQIFKNADTDGSGSVSKDELTQMLANAPAGQNGQSSSTGTATATAPNADDMFSKLDADGDGQISLSEFKSGMESMRAHGHHKGGGAAGDLSGSTDTIKKLLDAFKSALDQVQQSESTSATSSTTSTDASSSTAASASTSSSSTSTATTSTTPTEEQKIIAAFVDQLKQSGLYNPSGSSQSSSAVSLFSASA